MMLEEQPEVDAASYSEDGLIPSESEDETDSDDEEVEGVESKTVDGALDFVANQIEGDFDRIVDSINDSESGADGSLNKIWNVSFQQEFQDDIRAASGIGKTKGKGKGRRGRRHGPILSHQVRALIGEGNTAYFEGNPREAINKMMEVIRIEPRAISAWSVLATCYRDMNDPLKALQLSIMGAHLRHDADEWYNLAIESREHGHNQQALYCYGKAANLDPENFSALWDRASLAKETGELQTAKSAYLAILKRLPHDVTVLTELRQLLVETGDLRLCAQLYQQAFDHYTSMNPPVQVTTQKAVIIDPSLQGPGGFDEASHNQEFKLLEILVLADLYISLGAYEKAVKVIRAGCRWLQGRGKQRYWDACPDDREYDLEGWTRDSGDDERAGASGFKQGLYPLDVNARHRLGIARLKLGDLQEGRLQVDVVLSESVFDFSPLFTEIADAYFESNMFNEARPIYEMLGGDATTSSIHVLMRAASCRRSLGDVQDAAEVYEHILTVDPSNNDAKLKLAEIYEVENKFRKALDLVYQVIDSRKKGSTDDGAADGQEDAGATASGVPSTSLFAEKGKKKGKQKAGSTSGSKLTREEVIELEKSKEAEAIRGYQRLKQLWDDMNDEVEQAENEWLIEAEKLIDMFRESRNLFVTRGAHPFRGMNIHLSNRRRKTTQEAEEEDMASRLELNLDQETKSRKTKDGLGATSFRGIHFGDWLELFIQYAFLVTRRGQYVIGEEVLLHVRLSSVFQSRINQDKIRLAIIACSLRVKKFNVVLEHCRRLMTAYQFNNEPYRILLASLASGLQQTDCFIDTSWQKHLIREVRNSSAAVKGNLQWSQSAHRFNVQSSSKVVDEVDDENDPEPPDAEGLEQSEDKFALIKKPTKDNPVNVTIHAQTLTASKAYQGSLFFLLHALDYFPDDPMIFLSLCVASLGRAMQRQADNRNYLVTQAFGFLSRYRDLRGAGNDNEFADEIEFNFGRAFHHLGLFTHATKHYECVLQIVERKQQSDATFKGVAREAAYNLSLIYASTGASPLAQSLYRRWLTI